MQDNVFFQFYVMILYFHFGWLFNSQNSPSLQPCYSQALSQDFTLATRKLRYTFLSKVDDLFQSSRSAESVFQAHAENTSHRENSVRTVLHFQQSLFSVTNSIIRRWGPWPPAHRIGPTRRFVASAPTPLGPTSAHQCHLSPVSRVLLTAVW